ncbi:META domain-containing protein [Allomuricauda sp. d1]|uniref:META domain-containing protein n=1 Tax=Allomuricauda sp. d1 TaxID=3136725 RepID=UPI0031DE6E32
MKKRLIGLFSLFVVVLCFISCSTDADEIENNSNALSGSWQVMTVQVSSDEFTQEAPNGEVIEITFANDGRFTGSTSNNTFGGRYELDGMVLTMLEFTTTEVADTPYAGIFYDAIEAAILPGTTRAQFDFELSEAGTLTLRFSDSGVMALQR